MMVGSAQSGDCAAAAPAARARVLIVDDHERYARGLRRHLERASDLEVVGDARDGPTALTLAGDLRPDLVLLDIVLPGMNGVEVARRLREAVPEARVIALAGHPSWGYAFEIFAVGGAAFVPKIHVREHLFPVIRAVLKGECWISPVVYGAVARCSSPEDAPTGAALLGDELSARERAVVDMLDQRRSYKEMAEILGVSERTVETYRRRAMAKWGVTSTAQLVRRARASGRGPTG